MQTRMWTQELRGNRDLTSAQYGGTLGNKTGVTRRSEAPSRSSQTGIRNLFGAQSPTRKIYNQGVRRTSPERKQGEKSNKPVVVLPANEAARAALRRLEAEAIKNNKVVKPKAKKSKKKKKNT